MGFLNPISVMIVCGIQGKTIRRIQDMKVNITFDRKKIIIAVAVLIILSGCPPPILPPLFITAPPIESLEPPSLLDIPLAPDPVVIPLKIYIPQLKTSVRDDNFIMSSGVIIAAGSSVVISVPAEFYQRVQQKSGQSISNEFEFRTAGFYNQLEQYVERGLIRAKLKVKDRSKFEAKLRDLRDSGDVANREASPYNVALANLQKEMDSGKITRNEYAEQALQLRDKLFDSSRSSLNRQELTDISEVIRAAQGGDIMADYVLQVNELTVDDYTGSPLQLATRPEVQEVLRKNPGLRLGSLGEKGSIPSTLKQPWAQARFNAKLIDVKTGSIDWIGEYTIESLSVLNDGVRIDIGIRKRPTNAIIIIRALENYNNSVERAYRKVVQAKQALDVEYQDAMKEIIYHGKREVGERIQASRKQKVESAEKKYSRTLSEFRATVNRKPPERGMVWSFGYDVDNPTVTPDLLRPRNEEEKRKFRQHIKDLGSKVTLDLLMTIKTSM